MVRRKKLQCLGKLICWRKVRKNQYCNTKGWKKLRSLWSQRCFLSFLWSQICWKLISLSEQVERAAVESMVKAYLSDNPDFVESVTHKTFTFHHSTRRKILLQLPIVIGSGSGHHFLWMNVIFLKQNMYCEKRQVMIVYTFIWTLHNVIQDVFKFYFWIKKPLQLNNFSG